MSAKLTLKQYFAWRKYVMSLHMPHCAIILLDYLEINQGENWLFHETNIKKDTDLKGKDTFYKAKSELLNAGLITWQGLKNGIKIRVNYDVRKTDVQNLDVQKSDVQNPDNIERKKTERKGENKRKGEKAAVAAEGDRLSASAGAAASEAAPAAAAAADSPSPEISRSQDNKPRQSSKAAKTSKAAAIPLSQNPPAQADVEASVARVAAKSHVAGWTPEAIKFKAFTIWNHYELKKWKRADGTDITDLDSCVFCWMKRDGFRPPVMNEPAPAPHPSPVPAASPAPSSQDLSGLLPGQWAGAPIRKTQQKSFKQQEWDWIQRPLTDPDAFTVESAAHSIFNATCEDEVQGTLNSTPVHLRERALALAEQMRKEQGDRPRIITTPSTFTYENEDETS